LGSTIDTTTDEDFPGKIADMYTSINASRAYVYAVARACDRGQISRRVSKTVNLIAIGS
jgi:alkylation response protein AidB-like acyl-CoA dehydrogenase